MAIRFEYLISGDNVNNELSHGSWIRGETFQPLISHTLTSIKFKAWRKSGDPGTLYSYIRAVAGSPLYPTGGNISSGSMAGSAISTVEPGGWHEITMTSFNLMAGTTYALLFHGPDILLASAVKLRINNTNPYPRGRVIFSSNGGGTWGEYTANDQLFEEWGDELILGAPVGAGPAASLIAQGMI